MVNTNRVRNRRTADNPMNFISLLQKELRKIRTILTCITCN